MKRIFIMLMGICSLVILFYACSSAPGGGDSGSSSSSSSGSSGGIQAVYVATNGNDGNSGTNKTEPLKTIQLAIDTAAGIGLTNVYIAEGIYSPGNGLNPSTNGLLITNNNMNILGGFSADFSNRSGKSELDGTNGIFHIIGIDSVTNIRFDGFVIKNGKANVSFGANDQGGGMKLKNISYCLITNTVICSNYAGSWGGGIYILNSTGNVISADIVSNYAVGCGGGIFFDSGCQFNTVNSLLMHNYASSGGGIYIGEDQYNIIKGIVVSNTANSYAGGIYLNYSLFNVINAQIEYNKVVSGYGGGIYCYGKTNFISNAVFIGNSADSGGGLFLEEADGFITGCWMENNTSAHYGGGIYVYTSSIRITSNTITSNYAADAGGGIFSIFSPAVISFNSITSNFGGSWGDGIMLENSAATNIGNYIDNNNNNAIGLNYDNPGVALISNLIGNSTPGGYAVRLFSETSNYTLQNNLFITNKMSRLLYCMTNGVLIIAVTNDSDWVNINNTSRTLADAGSTNNGVTNM